jgi:predicted amidohydrolase YtcJ
MLTMEKSELFAVARKAREARFQLSIHAIGDRAVELAIQVLGASFGARGCKQLRHRIEHASLTDRELISKIGKLGIIASVQPRFIYSDSWAGERLGSERKKNLYPFASFRRNKVILTAGSDCPVEDPNPFEGLWSASERPGLEGEERLTVSEALEAYTTNPAYASFCEDRRGSLEPGKIADLVVVDRDPFECDLKTLRKTKVLLTMFGGRVYS